MFPISPLPPIPQRSSFPPFLFYLWPLSSDTYSRNRNSSPSISISRQKAFNMNELFKLQEIETSFVDTRKQLRMLHTWKRCSFTKISLECGAVITIFNTWVHVPDVHHLNENARVGPVRTKLAIGIRHSKHYRTNYAVPFMEKGGKEMPYEKMKTAQNFSSLVSYPYKTKE